MSGNEMTTAGFMSALEGHTNATFSDKKKVSIAKKKYLLDNKVEILQAVELGYSKVVIAETATAELLKTGLTATFSRIDKEGKELVGETKFNVSEIKKFCASLA